MERYSDAVRTACDIQIDGEAKANMEEIDGERLQQLMTLKKGASGDQV